LLYLAPPIPFKALRTPPLFTLIRFFCADHQYLGQSGWALEVIVAVMLVMKNVYEDFEHGVHVFQLSLGGCYRDARRETVAKRLRTLSDCRLFEYSVFTTTRELYCSPEAAFR
jgi:hypothetical protein